MFGEMRPGPALRQAASPTKLNASNALHEHLPMKTLLPKPNLVEQVRKALIEEIASGKLAPGERVVQEEIAQKLGVSRQPVQQALQLLLSQGVLRDAPGRRLVIARLDPDHIRHIYEMRAVIEGLACRRAAELNPEKAARQGPALIEAGRKAVATGQVQKMIAADMRFHDFVHAMSGNSLIAPALSPHLICMQQVMGQVLLRDEKPRDVWDEHVAILDAIASGAGKRAETLAREHITRAADFVLSRLIDSQEAVTT